MEKLLLSDLLTGKGHNSFQGKVKNADSCLEQRMTFPAHAFVCVFHMLMFRQKMAAAIPAPVPAAWPLDSAHFLSAYCPGLVLMTQLIPSGH